MNYFLSFRNMTTVEIDFAKLSLHNETSHDRIFDTSAFGDLDTLDCVPFT